MNPEIEHPEPSAMDRFQRGLELAQLMEACDAHDPLFENLWSAQMSQLEDGTFADGIRDQMFQMLTPLAFVKLLEEPELEFPDVDPTDAIQFGVICN